MQEDDGLNSVRTVSCYKERSGSDEKNSYDGSCAGGSGTAAVRVGGKEAEQFSFANGRLENVGEPVEGLDSDALNEYVVMNEDGTISYEVMGFALNCEPSQPQN